MCVPQPCQAAADTTCNHGDCHSCNFYGNLCCCGHCVAKGGAASVAPNPACCPQEACCTLGPCGEHCVDGTFCHSCIRCGTNVEANECCWINCDYVDDGCDGGDAVCCLVC